MLSPLPLCFRWMIFTSKNYSVTVQLWVTPTLFKLCQTKFENKLTDIWLQISDILNLSLREGTGVSPILQLIQETRYKLDPLCTELSVCQHSINCILTDTW
jgi:hypothetical protein